MKNVLLISYHFPPDGSVGALRSQKFAKYLPQHGWTPHVLTVQARHYRDFDPTRMADVASTSIRRTRALPSPVSTLLVARGSLLRAVGRADLLQDRVEANARMTAAERDAPDAGLLARLRRLLLSLGRLPDDEIGWLPLAVASGLRLCRRQRIDALFSTSPPHSGHLVGLVLKRLTRIPWVADFRDPWVDNPAKPSSFRSGASDRLDVTLERAVVRTADRVVLLTERLRGSFLGRYADQSPGKFHTIPNGFDADDFAALGPASRDRCFTVAHVGTLYHRRSPRVFLASVAKLLAQGKIPRSDIRIVFVGAHDGEHQPAVLGRSLGLQDVMDVSGPVSHREALMRMLRADLLCLFVQGWPDQIPAKTFEYLAAGAPILAIAGEGAAADFVTKVGGTVVPDEAWAIEDALYHHYLKARAGHSGVGPRPWTRGEVRPYDRRVLAGQLATILAEAGR